MGSGFGRFPFGGILGLGESYLDQELATQSRSCVMEHLGNGASTLAFGADVPKRGFAVGSDSDHPLTVEGALDDVTTRFVEADPGVQDVSILP
jgi:hypothetical protein